MVDSVMHNVRYAVDVEYARVQVETRTVVGVIAVIFCFLEDHNCGVVA